MKESFKYRWGGRERLKKSEFGERGVEGREEKRIIEMGYVPGRKPL
jgi:hypothetical protein